MSRCGSLAPQGELERTVLSLASMPAETTTCSQDVLDWPATSTGSQGHMSSGPFLALGTESETEEEEQVSAGQDLGRHTDAPQASHPARLLTHIHWQSRSRDLSDQQGGESGHGRDEARGSLCPLPSHTVKTTLTSDLDLVWSEPSLTLPLTHTLSALWKTVKDLATREWSLPVFPTGGCARGPQPRPPTHCPLSPRGGRTVSVY